MANIEALEAPYTHRVTNWLYEAEGVGWVADSYLAENGRVYVHFRRWSPYYRTGREQISVVSTLRDDEIFDLAPNVELFQASLDHITYHPETWDQQNWLRRLARPEDSVSAAPECGTAGCLAGTVSLLSGWRPAGNQEYGTWTMVTFQGEPPREVDALAYELLGMDEEYSLDIFGGDNKLQTLWDRAQVLCAGQLTVPEENVIAEAQEISSHLYED